MTSKSDATIRIEYADVLAGTDDAATLRLIRELESQCRPGDPWDDLPAAPLARTLYAADAGTAIRPKPWWRRFGRMAPLGAVLAVALLAVSLAVAAGAITNLGKPTNTTSTVDAFPLSGFHRVKDNLRVGGKPELLFLAAGGTNAPDSILMERWPIVKALTQFGRLSGVKSVDSACRQMSNWPYPICSIPTFDFSHAIYTSPYLAFSSRDLIRWVGDKDSVYQKMSPVEMRIFEKYAAFRGPLTCWKPGPSGRDVPYRCHGYLHLIEDSFSNPTTHHLPLLMIGNYLQLDSQDMVSGDFAQQIPIPTAPTSHPGLTMYDKVFNFSTVQNALEQGKDPVPGSHLVEDVNGEANIMTALICHADGLRPAAVCGRSGVRQILKQVK